MPSANIEGSFKDSRKLFSGQRRAKTVEICSCLPKLLTHVALSFDYCFLSFFFVSFYAANA